MLKQVIITSFKELRTSRYLATLSAVLIVLSVAFALYIALTVRPSELQLVTHYSAYGMTHLYRAQWWYLLSFALFGIMVAIFHIAISLKIFMAKGHPLAVMYAWIGVGIILFAWITSASIINIWSPA